MQKMSMEDYQKAEGVSRSMLVNMLRSPAHALYHKEHSKVATPAMVLGSAFHTLVLEPELFDKEYLVAQIDRRTKEGKAIAEKAKEENLQVLNSDEMNTLTMMQYAIKSNHAASTLLKNGEAETSYFGQLNDVLCKCRADFKCNDGIVVDLKSCLDASPEAFNRSILSMSYHVQAAFYLDLMEACGATPTYFVFIAVEKEAPFAVATYTLSQDYLELGRKQYKKALEIYKECLENNFFHGYSAQVLELTPPIWALNKDKINE